MASADLCDPCLVKSETSPIAKKYSQVNRPCPIKYKLMKPQHPQVQQDRKKALLEFTTEGQVNIKRAEQYDLEDMAVTSDNKILLYKFADYCPKVYIYKNYKTYEDKISFHSLPFCITVIPCTDKSVVSLPREDSIQFINTTINTKDKKIDIGEWCGVTAVKDKISIGGEDKVFILNTDESRVELCTIFGLFTIFGVFTIFVLFTIFGLFTTLDYLQYNVFELFTKFGSFTTFGSFKKFGLLQHLDNV